MPTIFEEVSTVSKLKPKAGQSADEYAYKVAKKLNDDSQTPQTAWDSLSDAAQQWTKGVMEIQHDKRKPHVTAQVKSGKSRDAATAEAVKKFPLPLLEGYPARAADDEDDPPASAKTPTPDAPEAEEAAPPPKTKAKAPKGGKVTTATMKRGRTPIYADDAKIKLLVDENPHTREGTGRHKRWALYKDGMTVAQAIAAGLNYGNLRHSVEDKHIKIVNT